MPVGFRRLFRNGNALKKVSPVYCQVWRVPSTKGKQIIVTNPLIKRKIHPTVNPAAKAGFFYARKYQIGRLG
jgi:hypothetical protein